MVHLASSGARICEIKVKMPIEIRHLYVFFHINTRMHTAIDENHVFVHIYMFLITFIMFLI